MSLPTDSVAPAPPTGSSNPWSLVQWWKRICDWIAALSPSGADKYDTGWVDVLPTGWTGTAAVRRIGKTVSMRGRVNRSAGNFSSSTDVFTLPPEFRVSSFTSASTITTNSVVAAYLTIGSTGVVAIAPFASANNFFINHTWMLD